MATSTLVLIFLLHSGMAYQYFHRFHRYHPPYRTLQKYIAVPGLVQQVNEIPVASVPVATFQFPILHRYHVPFHQPYYELETDSSSSPPQEPEPRPPSTPPPPPPSQPPSENEHHPHPPSDSKPTYGPNDTHRPPINEPPSDNRHPPYHPPPHQHEMHRHPPNPPSQHRDPHPHPDNNDHPNSQPSSGKLIHKHISVHAPPQEFDDDSGPVRVVRPEVPEASKHINIVFVKAPTTSHSRQTEVILPETPEQKTLIYVLVRKPSPMDGIKIKGPPPTNPPKPQVFFIRYKGDSPVHLTQSIRQEKSKSKQEGYSK